MTDCGGCAACWRCRREMRLIEAPIEVSEEVRAKAAEVMARLDTPPLPKQRAAPVRAKKAVALKAPRTRTPVKRKTLPDDQPVPCLHCGGMRGLIKAAQNSQRLVLVGKDGLCEVCLDKPVLEALLAQHEAGQVKLTYERLSRARRYTQRVLKEGRAFHPEAAHGSGYTGYGCRCIECTSARTEYMRGHRLRTEEAEKTQP